jgi:hypothetical protein
VYNTVCGWCLRFRAGFDPVYFMDFCVILIKIECEDCLIHTQIYNSITHTGENGES